MAREEIFLRLRSFSPLLDRINKPSNDDKGKEDSILGGLNKWANLNVKLVWQKICTVWWSTLQGSMWVENPLKATTNTQCSANQLNTRAFRLRAGVPRVGRGAVRRPRGCGPRGESGLWAALERWAATPRAAGIELRISLKHPKNKVNRIRELCLTSWKFLR